MYPNLFMFIVAHPGVGKSRTIGEGRRYYRAVPEHKLAPISMRFASVVDFLKRSKKTILHAKPEPLEYNHMYICADELGAFMHKHDEEMIDGLSAFYDATPYGQHRRTSDLKIDIESPLINMIAGSTPSNLLGFMPEKAWDQGFTSRLMLIFSDERIVGDDFENTKDPYSEDLEHDLLLINNITGEFQVTDDYRQCVANWKELGCPPVPNHPKLTHYVTRRPAHLYKLSMISAIDRGPELILTRDDFNTAMNWLVDAEIRMPDIFKAGASNADGKALEEIVHYIRLSDKGTGVSENQIRRFARDRIPIHSIMRVIDILAGSGQIILIRQDKRSGIRYFRVTPDLPEEGDMAMAQ